MSKTTSTSTNKTASSSGSKRRRRRRREKRIKQLKVFSFLAILCVLVVGAIMIAIDSVRPDDDTAINSSPDSSSDNTSILSPESSSIPDPDVRTAYICSNNTTVNVVNTKYEVLETLTRGTLVTYAEEDSELPNYEKIKLADDGYGYVLSSNLTDEYMDCITESVLFLRTPQNLVSEDGMDLGTWLDKGSELQVTGFDRLNADGTVNMYRIQNGDEVGYIRSQYVTYNYTEATTIYEDEDGDYKTHAARVDKYGGGDAASLDYYPREKASFAENVMPTEVRALYLCHEVNREVDEFIELADSTGINAFVIDIVDGTAVSCPLPAMQKYSPSAYANSVNTFEDYKAAVQKIKDAGYYVIGRITVFNDAHLVTDHPEWSICDPVTGKPLYLAGSYWPSAFCREVWEYKVELAKEAVELLGFNEINFDYCRFPDRTRSYETAGTIDFHNEYNETKAQAIQRFLMYACDVLHDSGVYVSADVFGEAAYNYVTAYGQYWPAISNIVDVISGMPYPDHFAASGTWLPWTHPYETLYNWGSNVAVRQKETSSPAVVRTWIQAYNAIRSPFNNYGPEEITAQIKGLIDTGNTGGYMTWNGGSRIAKYTELAPAFVPNFEENVDTGDTSSSSSQTE